MSTPNRNTRVIIAGRKIDGYPTVNFVLEFSDVDDLIKKIDSLIDDTGYGKVDVYLEDESIFSKEEIKKLEGEWITFM